MALKFSFKSLNQPIVKAPLPVPVSVPEPEKHVEIENDVKQEDNHSLKELISHHSDQSINKQEIITSVTINIVTDLLKEISKDFHIGLTELTDKYLSEFQQDHTYRKLIDSLLTTPRQKIIQSYQSVSNIVEDDNVSESDSNVSSTQDQGQIGIDSEKCLARTALGKQCSRKKLKADFCGGHETKLPHGRMDIPLHSSTAKSAVNMSSGAKKRGRPKKFISQSLMADHDHENDDEEDDQEMRGIIISGIEYLINDSGDLFKFTNVNGNVTNVSPKPVGNYQHDTGVLELY